MDEARAVLERLERIDAMLSEGSPASLLLAEIRELLAEADGWLLAELEGAELHSAELDPPRAALGRCRARLAARSEHPTTAARS